MTEETILHWQDFQVTGGVIARNQSGQIEGHIDLGGELVFTFVLGPDPTATWGWFPHEPPFTPTRVEDDLDD